MRAAAAIGVRCLLVLAGIFCGVLLTGCASTDPENISSRPWNSPKGWEVGLPGQFYDQRR